MDAIGRLREARAQGGQWWFAGALIAALVGYAANAVLRPSTSGGIVLTLFLFWRVWRGGSLALFVTKCLFMLGIVFMMLGIWAMAGDATLDWLHLLTFATWCATLYCLTAPAVERLGDRDGSEVSAPPS